MEQQQLLEIIWYVVFIILLTGYAILDGFDLGVGMVHLFAKKDEDRRKLLNSIGPVWDGNEVWLVTAGGALFAGFPGSYATLCSAFYVPFMILLTGLIFRAVAIEFRSKQPMQWWRQTWDVLFSFASFVIAGGIGLMLGNLITGIPLDASMEYIGDFRTLLSPFAIMISVTVISLLALHGAIFALMKTDGELHEIIRGWIHPLIVTFIMLYVISTVATLIFEPYMAEKIRERPYFFLIGFLNMLVIANIPREIYWGRDGRAFISSCANIVLLMALYGIGSFPNMVRASNDPANLSLTIHNTASSPYTLTILLIIAGIGVPLVLSYTTMIYYIFHGKVRLDASSY